jgi:hypothetical protein
MSDLPKEVVIGDLTYKLRMFTPKFRGQKDVGHDWVRQAPHHVAIVGAEVHALIDEIVRMREAKVFVLMQWSPSDPPDAKTQLSEIVSIHSTSQGAMQVVADRFPDQAIRWKHHDAHGESWNCEFHIPPFWHEFSIHIEEVQTP